MFLSLFFNLLSPSLDMSVCFASTALTADQKNMSVAFVGIFVPVSRLVCVCVFRHLAVGITVSGGQKARISLARAMYSGCAVVLLDDPLSALDNIVGNWVFKRAVCEMARESVVVMATHQRQVRHRSQQQRPLAKRGDVGRDMPFSGVFVRSREEGEHMERAGGRGSRI